MFVERYRLGLVSERLWVLHGATARPVEGDLLHQLAEASVWVMAASSSKVESACQS